MRRGGERVDARRRRKRCLRLIITRHLIAYHLSLTRRSRTSHCFFIFFLLFSIPLQPEALLASLSPASLHLLSRSFKGSLASSSDSCSLLQHYMREASRDPAFGCEILRSLLVKEPHHFSPSFSRFVFPFQ